MPVRIDADGHCSPTPYCDDPAQTGVGQWCAPGPDDGQKRVFIIRYEDSDVRDRLFTDEETARKAFANAEARGWNCSLLATLARQADDQG